MRIDQLQVPRFNLQPDFEGIHIRSVPSEQANDEFVFRFGIGRIETKQNIFPDSGVVGVIGHKRNRRCRAATQGRYAYKEEDSGG
ncbi:hypothetical protein [Paenibacillus cymbidii]|uniref:hypothetical protein n=1 Tax=Paenibacillus cymbidii TaxID=1639034 RepID=UPI0014367285|nr:hypothetical protein [Paenibacillus cymbidii]